MDAHGRVRVAGPSRVVLAVATGALVALTSAATAFVVLSGTGSVVDRPALEPLPPAAAPPAAPPVVVLPPGGLGMPVPELPASRPAPAPALGGVRSDAPVVLAAPPTAVVPLAPLLPELPLPLPLPPAPATDGQAPTPPEPVVVQRVPVSAPLFGTADDRDVLGALRRTVDDGSEFRRRGIPAVPASVTGSRAVPAVPAAPERGAAAKAQPGAANAGKIRAEGASTADGKKQKAAANNQKAGAKKGPGKKSSARAHREGSAEAGARKGAGRSKAAPSGHRGQHRGHRA